MKLLYLVNARIPTEKAHGVQIMKMCEAFVGLGVDLELVVPKRQCKEDPFEFYGVQKKFRITRLPVIDTFASGAWGFWLASASFAVISLFYALFKAKDVIIYSRDQDQFSFFTVPLINKPYFFEIHGPKENSWLYAWLFTRIKGIIATNNFNKQKLIDNFKKTRDKVIVLRNSVDVTKFNLIDQDSARIKLGLAKNKKIILYAGHFYRWKGIEALIQAAGFLDEDVLVYLLGGNAKDIERLKQEQVIPNNLIFVGFLQYHEMPIWYAAADVLVLTGTKDDRYSFYHTSPVKLYEYIAAQRVIVAVDSPAIRDAVDESEVFFYQPNNAHDLSKKIKLALQEKDLSKAKIQNVYQKVKDYTWDIRAAKIMQFIKDKLNNKSL